MRNALLGLILVCLPILGRAEEVKATVGHMCCAGCQSAATAGLKKLDWVENVSIDGKTVTVTAKAGQKADYAGILDALTKSGFPPAELSVNRPIVLTVAHLCCAGCVNDLKAKLPDLRNQALDKESVKVDEAAKTVTMAPLSGRSLNLVALLREFERRTGCSASKIVSG